MKRLLCIFVIITALLQLTGCNLMAANIYTRYDINEDGVEIKVEVMYKNRDKNDITIERYYHPDGWLQKEISYNDYRSKDIMYIMIFNENGTKKSAEYFYKENDGRIYESYDESGTLLSTHNYEKDVLQFIEEFYPSGNRSKVTDYTDKSFSVNIRTFADAEGGEMLTDYSKWQENGEITEETDYYSSGVRTKVEMYITTPKGEFVRHYVDEYNSSENLSKTTHYDENGNIYDVVYH